METRWPDERLRRAERLRGRTEIRQVLERGARWECASFGVRWIESELPHDRVATLTRRTLGPATVRNRTKRLLREVFRTHKGKRPPFHDIVLIARKPIVSGYREIACRYEEWKRGCGKV